MKPNTGYVPPQNIEAEQVVLGSCMLSSDIVPEVVEILIHEDFYRESHKIIFSGITKLFNEGKNPDLVTISQELSARLEEIGGAAYLAMLVDCIPINVPQHCEIIKELAIKRQIINGFTGLIGKAYNNHPLDMLLDEVSDTVLSFSQHEKTGPVHINSFIDAEVDGIEEQKNNRDPVFGIPTGLADLDAKTGGLHKGEYVIIAARPGMGKTTCALQFADSAAEHGEGVLIFSLEMTKERLLRRNLSARSRVHGNKIRTGFINDSEMVRIFHSAEGMKGLNIFIDDTPGLSITQMTARAKRLAMRHKIGLIIVDYIQLATGSSENRALEIGQISAGLLAMAKSLNVAMVGLSQLNRNLENRPDKRPKISDLKESGALEQDADTILLLYRDEVYNEDTPEKGIAEIIIGKGRDIGNWTVKTTFQGEITKFGNLAKNR